MRTMLPEEFIVQPKDLEALRRTRTGILITADIGRKYGWHIGDRIPLTSSTLQTNGSATWTFDIVGMATLSLRDEGVYVFAPAYRLTWMLFPPRGPPRRLSPLETTLTQSASLPL